MRLSGGWDAALYARLLGNANAFKEGDTIVHAAAPDEAARLRAGCCSPTRRGCGDDRPKDVIRVEFRVELAGVRSRGVFLAEGHGRLPEDLEPRLATTINALCADAEQSIWADFDVAFRASQAGAYPLAVLGD